MLHAASAQSALGAGCRRAPSLESLRGASFAARRPDRRWRRLPGGMPEQAARAVTLDTPRPRVRVPHSRHSAHFRISTWFEWCMQWWDRVFCNIMQPAGHAKPLPRYRLSLCHLARAPRFHAKMTVSRSGRLRPFVLPTTCLCALSIRRRECSLGSNDNTYYCILPVIRRGTRLRRVITLLRSFVLGVKQLLFHVSLSESTALNSWVGRNKPLTAIGLELWRCRWFAVTH